MPVSDKDIADKIRKVAPGGTWADVKAAWAVVRGRLSSHDDDKTIAAMEEVIARADTPAEGDDREAAERILKRYISLYFIRPKFLEKLGVRKQKEPAGPVYIDPIVMNDPDGLNWLRGQIADALSAARKAEREKVKAEMREARKVVAAIEREKGE
jgi:hypothetical protein